MKALTIALAVSCGLVVSVAWAQPVQLVQPQARTRQNTIIEYVPLPLCNLARNADHIVFARVVGIGAEVEIAGTADRSEGVFTPVTLDVVVSLKGRVPAQFEVLVAGTASATGKIDEGELRLPNGQFREGWFFLVEGAGRYFLHGGGGFFWRESGAVRNGWRMANGIAEQTLVSEIARQPSSCPAFSRASP